MKLGLGNQLVINPVNSVPLGERPTLGISFDRSRYTNPLGYANQASVGSADFKLQSYAGPSPIFTRATAATFRGSNGLIQYAPENLLQWSEDFSNGNWVRTGIAAFGSGSVSNAVLAPNNELTADLIVEDTTTGVHRIESISALTMAANDIAAFSVFVKTYGSTNEVGISFRDGGLVIFNLASKTYLTYQQPPAGTVLSSSIDDVGNGWFRLQSTIQSVGSYNRRAGVQLCLNGQPSYQGSSSRGAYVWGMQLERSSTARPYISTTTTPRYGPRFEYDTNGEPLGLLMEEQSENKLSYSEQFDNAAWAKFKINPFGSGSVANTTATLDPRGSNTADFVQEDSTLDNRLLRNTVSAANGVYTFTCFVKAAGRNYCILTMSDGATGDASWGFDLLNGTSTPYSLPSGSWSGISSSIYNAGNGWFRCSITATKNAGSNILANIYLYNGSNITYQGNGTSGIYIWGAQLEQKPFATSYIPTVASSVVRNADVVSVPVGSWYDTTAGTILFEGDRIATATNNAQGYDSFFSFYSNLAAYNVLSHLGASDYEQFEAALDGFGSSAYTYVGTEITPNTPIKFAITYDSPLASASTYYAAVNGFAPATTSGADPLETPDTLRIGCIDGNSVLFGPLSPASYFNGHIKSFTYTAKYWPDDVQALTT